MSGALRPRYGRISAFGLSVVVTGTALLGGAGVLPLGGQPSYAAERTGSETSSDTNGEPGDPGAVSFAAGSHSTQAAEGSDGREDDQASLALPPDSGEGKRVVFDVSDQRVWLVQRDGTVRRTYLVSGSIYDNLEPDSYEVYSRSENAIGIEDSGTMRYMVRFAHGENAAIGFHDIPISEGTQVQSRDELGTPLSHGCVRQARPDAKALWRFAPLGTTVVVTD